MSATLSVAASASPEEAVNNEASDGVFDDGLGFAIRDLAAAAATEYILPAFVFFWIGLVLLSADPLRFKPRRRVLRLVSSDHCLGSPS